jgi:Dehydratase family
MTAHQLRSRNWFGRNDLDGFVHRSWLKAEGFSDAVFDGRPVVGIANSWSELTNCNAHLRQVADAVKRGVWSAGGFPVEFPTISLGEVLMKPTTMLFRNLMAMDVEECLRAYPLDAAVLQSGCDKTTPAMLMGAASADIPAVMVTGGPMLSGKWRAEELGSGTDAWRLWAERRAGRLTDEELCEAESCMSRSSGHCSDGHRLHDGLDGRGAGNGPAGQRRDPGIGLAAAGDGRDGRTARGRDGAGRRAQALADPHGAGLRQRDPRRHGDRRLHERHHSSRCDRRSRRRAATARALRRAVEDDALPRESETVGNLKVSDDELARRKAAWKSRPPHFTRGYGRLFLDHVLQANEGCDFDYLKGRTPVRFEDTAGPSHS